MVLVGGYTMRELKDYKLLDQWNMTRDLAIKLMALGVIAMSFFAWFFNALYLWITGECSSIYVNLTNNNLLGTLYVIVVVIGTFVIHELFHGFFFRKFGAKPVYGAGIAYHVMPYFYATSKEKVFFTRKQFITILLAPLVGISTVGTIFILAFPSNSEWIIFPMIINAAGAIADMWMTRTLLRYPKYVMLTDDKDGMAVYGKKEDKSLNSEPSGIMKTFAKSTLRSFFIITILMLVVLPMLLAIFQVSEFTIRPKDSLFTIFEHKLNVGKEGSYNAQGVLLPSVMLSAFAGLIQTILTAGSKTNKK